MASKIQTFAKKLASPVTKLKSNQEPMANYPNKSLCLKTSNLLIRGDAKDD